MLATRQSVVSIVVGLAIALCSAGDLRAQDDKSARVTELISVLEGQPKGAAAQDWKEQRREAARELGLLDDPRAVPALIRIVETEEFDIVGEIAIKSLGQLGDERAVGPLRRVAADPSRDRDQREAARKALKRLGAAAEAAQAAAEAARAKAAQEADESTGLSTAGATSTTLIAGDATSAAIPKGPVFDDDTLAAGELVRFAIGSLSMQYDSIRDRPSMTGDAAGSYERRVDKKRSAWRYGGDASVALGFVNFPGADSSSRFSTLNVMTSGEGRVYTDGNPVYGGVLGSVGTSATTFRIYRPSGMNSYEMITNADVQAGLTVGYGRVLDVGEALRLRRIEKVLRETKTLGRPITPDLAEKILGAWWALRRELGAHRRLVVTVTLLREAGVLLGEPNASTTYKILQVLLDGQLTHRLTGLDVGLGFMESYLMRDDFLPVDEGRAETVIGRARFGHQNPTGERELVAEGFGRYRVFAGDEAAPWAVGAKAELHAFFYGPNYDPIGAIEIGGELGAGNDDIGDSNTGTRVAGTAGWRWTFNRASNVRVAGRAALEGGELFIGITLDGVYGFLDAGFVGAGSIPAALR